MKCNISSQMSSCYSEDLAQEAFLRVHISLHQLYEPGKFGRTSEFVPLNVDNYTRKNGLSMTEDEILIKQFKNNDPDAFSKLMNKYKTPIFNYVRHKIGRNNDDAYDITQEVFVKVYKALPNWEPRASFQTWLYTIARNRCIDYHRAKSRRKFHSIDDEEIFIPTPPATDIYSDPEKMAEESQLGRIISESIEQLSPKQKEVFILHHYQGLQIKEIAKVLGMAEGSVKVHHHRAMKKLRKILGPMREKGDI